MYRLVELKERIGAVTTDERGLHDLAAFVFDSVTGANDFLSVEERNRIARRTQGYTTGADQLLAWERGPATKNRHILTARRDGIYSLTVTDELPYGAVNRYGLSRRSPHESSANAFLTSPFVNRLIGVVIEPPQAVRFD